jgi:hypothetical protein
VPAGSVRAIGKLKQLKNRNSLINGLENNGIKVTSENIVDIITHLGAHFGNKV